MSKNEKKYKNSIIKYTVSELNVKFPQSKYLNQNESERIKKAIAKGAKGTVKNKVIIEKKAIAPILATDPKGVRIVYDDLEENDKVEDGGKQYISLSAIDKEISERLQQPRDATQIKKLKYSEDCLQAVRDSEKLQNERLLEESRNRNGFRGVRDEVIKERGSEVCEITGTPIENGDIVVHHKVRRAECPEKTLDKENLVVVNGTLHRENSDIFHSGNTKSSERGKSKICPVHFILKFD